MPRENRGELRVRRFTPAALLPSCLHDGKPVPLNGQSQGWMCNACVKYPPSAKELEFRAEQEVRERRAAARRARDEADRAA